MEGIFNQVFMGRKQQFKMHCVSNADGRGGIGILLAERWVDKIIEVIGICDRIINSKTNHRQHAILDSLGTGLNTLNCF